MWDPRDGITTSVDGVGSAALPALNAKPNALASSTVVAKPRKIVGIPLRRARGRKLTRAARSASRASQNLFAPSQKSLYGLELASHARLVVEAYARSARAPVAISTSQARNSSRSWLIRSDASSCSQWLAFSMRS
jgi:hypothetical protein